MRQAGKKVMHFHTHFVKEVLCIEGGLTEVRYNIDQNFTAYVQVEWPFWRNEQFIIGKSGIITQGGKYEPQILGRSITTYRILTKSSGDPDTDYKKTIWNAVQASAKQLKNNSVWKHGVCTHIGQIVVKTGVLFPNENMSG